MESFGTLRHQVSLEIDNIRDAIAWQLVWKTGRAWNIESIYVEMGDDGRIEKFDDDRERELVERALAEDKNAILVNAYYMNLGGLEDVTVKDAAGAIRYFYEEHIFTAEGVYVTVETEADEMGQLEHKIAENMAKSVTTVELNKFEMRLYSEMVTGLEKLKKYYDFREYCEKFKKAVRYFTEADYESIYCDRYES